MTSNRRMTKAMAKSLLEAAITRLWLSRDGTIRIDEVEGRAIELLLRGGLGAREGGEADPAGGSPEPARVAPDMLVEGAKPPSFGKVGVGGRSVETEVLDLDLAAAHVELDVDPEARLCLDFGTAFTKAYAMQGWSDPVDIELGSYAGSDSPLMVESSVWIDGDGIHFGPDAIAASEGIPAGRRRFDSMKKRLLGLEEGGSPMEPVGTDINPWAGRWDFTELGLLTLYLAYVTHLLSTALEAEGLPKHLPGRLTRPCWSGESGKPLSALLRVLVAKAIILADTLGDELTDGLDAGKAAAALDAVDRLPGETISAVIESLLREDLSEPEAVAAPFEAEKDWHFLTVVDVGAGTTDVATFLLRAHPNWERGKTMLVPGSRGSLAKAGDEIDRILFDYLRRELREGLEPGGAAAMEAWLRSTIRDHKLRLFRDGIVEASHGGATVVLGLEGFMAFDDVKLLGSDMVAMLGRTFAAMPGTLVEKIVEKGGVRLLLSGGGANLPMARALADQTFPAKTGTIRARLTDVRPEWESSKDEDFRSIYPQLAVAVGGASPFLPEAS